MWDALKKNKFVVKVYEFVFTPIHHIKYKISLVLPSFEKCHYSYGELNKDKKFYVIKFDSVDGGMFGVVFWVIRQIEYALRKNKKYIPIIDCRETYLHFMQNPENAGKENAWDYYFEQPKGDYSLDDVYRSKHVIYVRKKAPGRRKPFGYKAMPMPEQELCFWNDLLIKYIRPNSSLKERIERECTALFSNKKVLGISIRSEYRAGGLLKLPLYCHHPRGMSCDEVIAEIDRLMSEWGYEYFFFACDDREYSDRIASYYGEQCIRMNRRLFHWFENGEPIPYESIEALRNFKTIVTVEFDNYTVQQKTEDYIVETYLLSKCDSLYTDGGSGSRFAYIANGGKYKHFEMHETGLWTEEDMGIRDQDK